jgi:cytoskeletal protein CcmA (bactofilin family)
MWKKKTGKPEEQDNKEKLLESPMKAKKKEKPEGQSGKQKLFNNPMKPVETTLISASVILEGSIEAEGTLIVEGSVSGTVKCSSLEILENGRVEANIEGENVTVAGDFEGEIICSGKLSILRTGKVLGKISYGALSIESGGLLDGTLSKFNAKDTVILPFYKEEDQSQ